MIKSSLGQNADLYVMNEQMSAVVFVLVACDELTKAVAHAVRRVSS